jgi:hypothetical protein
VGTSAIILLLAVGDAYGVTRSGTASGLRGIDSHLSRSEPAIVDVAC